MANVRAGGHSLDGVEPTLQARAQAAAAQVVTITLSEQPFA
jgi:hypothetical protein